MAGGALAKSSFEDLNETSVQDDCFGLRIAASNDAQLQRFKELLQILEQFSPSAKQVILKWIERVALPNGSERWNNFGDGTVFLWFSNEIPNNVFAAYLYRCALEVCLCKRFKRFEAIVNDPRCKLITHRRELQLMRILECDNKYKKHHEDIINEQLKLLSCCRKLRDLIRMEKRKR